MNRREFVGNTTLATTAALFSLKCKAEQYKSLGGFGLQLWSVRHDMDKDWIGTLKSIADIGFSDIECAGYNSGLIYGQSVKDFGDYIKSIGLTMKSCHTRTGAGDPEQVGTMTNEWERICEDIKSLGGNSLVCGYFDEFERQTIDDYKRHAELFNKCGEKAKEYGLMFGHHNHDFEFFEIDGQVPYDILLDETDPDLVCFELDHYWIKKGGADPFAYFEKYPGRFPFWHVKDMDETEEQFFTEVGTGIIDWEPIFKAEAKSGMQYFYVEQDEFKKYDPLESVKMSHDYLKGFKY